jgi:hypothetical protein
MSGFYRRRSGAALAVGIALAVVPAVAVSATRGSNGPSNTTTSAQDKPVAPRPAVPNAPPAPGSIRTNLVSFDIIAAGGRAAEVNANTVTFTFVTGWTQITRPAVGIYCLNGAGFNYPAVVSVAARPGLVSPVYGYVEYDSFGVNCPGVQVNTYQVT